MSAVPIRVDAFGAAAPRSLRDALARRQPHLAAAAELALLAILPCLVALALDERTVNGISVWVKPIKFLLSFAIYWATLAWAFGYLPAAAQRTRAGRFVIHAAIIVGALELAWLISAAAHGVPAHFNDGAIGWQLAYSAAGAGSVVLLAAIAVQGGMIARNPAVAQTQRWAFVAGALVASVGTLIVAGYLSAGTGHWVGGDPTDANGLPLLGWSRTGGDLRVAHFWSLHAQQALPLFGLLLVRWGAPGARGAVVIAALAYSALIAATFVQALRGLPFLAFIGS
ncbi:MAG TPA: hypothetical protein VM491_16030 [Burkholderiaceae bacterium]|jgi:hypothetical protein|nr:hypothetical protein [Burkholderiaceae bacterium]